MSKKGRWRQLWPMFCWETLSPGINVGADHIHHFIGMCLQYIIQDIAHFYTAEITREWFEEHDKEFKELPWAPNSPDLNPIEHTVYGTTGPTNLIHGDSMRDSFPHPWRFLAICRN